MQTHPHASAKVISFVTSLHSSSRVKKLPLLSHGVGSHLPSINSFSLGVGSHLPSIKLTARGFADVGFFN